MSHQSLQREVLNRYSQDYFKIVLASFFVAVAFTSALVGPAYRRLEKVRFQLLLMIMSFAGGIIVVELAVRILDPLGISHYTDLEAYGRDKIPDEDLIYKHQNNIRKTYFGFEERFNEIGLRDRPIGPKEENEYRILILGDSVTYGVGVRVEDTFSRKLEAQLTQKLDRPVRTINSGVASYNTVQEATFCFKHWDRINPDLVILLYVDNDIAVASKESDRIIDGTFRGKSPAQKIQMILGQSWTYRVIVHSVRRVHGSAPVIDRQSRGWTESMDALRSIGRHSKARNVPFLTFMWRNHAGPLSDAQWEDISALSKSEDVPACDTLPWFVGKDLKTLTNSAVDVHPSAAGHQILADGMERFLMRTGILPDP